MSGSRFQSAPETLWRPPSGGDAPLAITFDAHRNAPRCPWRGCWHHDPHCELHLREVGFSAMSEPTTSKRRGRWACKAGCPIGNEPLGTDYDAAVERAETVLLPGFDAWRSGGLGKFKDALIARAETLDSIFAEYRADRRYT